MTIITIQYTDKDGAPVQRLFTDEIDAVIFEGALDEQGLSYRRRRL